MTSIDRRTFAATAAAGIAGATTAAALGARPGSPSRRGEPFGLAFAPHFGMFNALCGDDLDDQLRFAADEGFRAWEDNWMGRRDPAEQERLGARMRDLDIRMGVFVAHADFGSITFGSDAPEMVERIETEMRAAVETAKRCGAKWCTVVPGLVDPRVHPDFQTAVVIDNLRRACDVIESAGLVMVLEPLNRRDHPNLFLTGVPQAFAICRAVDRPSCKILDDLYHQQITEGNLIPYMDRAWSEIAYFQVGDNPGRREPTTGEINYKRVFEHIRSRGFEGVVGMEHGLSLGGEAGARRLIEAYREVDPAT